MGASAPLSSLLGCAVASRSSSCLQGPPMVGYDLNFYAKGPFLPHFSRCLNSNRALPCFASLLHPFFLSLRQSRLCCSGWSGTHCLYQAGLKLPKIHLLGLKVHATRPHQASLNLLNSVHHPALASQVTRWPAHENTSEHLLCPSVPWLLPMTQ